MKKLYAFAVLVIFGFVLNFTLWFLHTRTINESVATLKKELGMKGILLSFDDVRYTNFRAWKVKGALFHPKIVRGDDPKTEITLTKIDFISQPFESRITFLPEGDIMIKQIDGEQIQEYKAVYKEEPNLEIEFDTSLDSLNETIQLKEDDKNPFGDIKSIKYSDSGFAVFDLIQNTKYLDLEANKISLKTDSSTEYKKVDFLLDFQGANYNPEYKASPNEEALLKTSASIGKASLFLDISFQELPSKSQQEYIESLKEQKKKAKVKTVLDSVKLDLKALRLNTSKFNFSLGGNIDKQPGTVMPYMDLSLTITDYSNFIEYYARTLNLSIDEMVRKQPLMPVKKISSQQVNGVKKLIKSFAGDSKDVTLKLYNAKEGGFTISDRPFKEVFEEIQAILFSNIGFSDKAPQYKSLKNLKKPDAKKGN